jgi:hypothetical protein
MAQMKPNSSRPIAVTTFPFSLPRAKQREGHWTTVDLVGKGGHIRTVPMPDWMQQAIDHWLNVAEIARGKIFRCVCRKGAVWGTAITEKESGTL